MRGKRILSLVLAALLALGCCGTAFAAEGEEDAAEVLDFLPETRPEPEDDLYGYVNFDTLHEVEIPVGYAAVQLAMVVVALLLGATGVAAMELVTDVLTAYTIIVMSCGFCLFASFAVIKMLARAAKRRLWRTDRATGEIDKGPAWRERHEFDKKED